MLFSEGVDTILDVHLRGLSMDDPDMTFKSLLETALDRIYEERQKELIIIRHKE